MYDIKLEGGLLLLFIPYIFHEFFFQSLTLSLPETKIADFANSVDLDEVAHHEPPHLDLHCFPSSL